MTAPFLRPRSAARIWLWTAVAALLVSLVLAPVQTSTLCVDNYRDPELSYCESTLHSLAGNETNEWIWIAAVVAIVAVGWLVARRHKARDAR